MIILSFTPIITTGQLVFTDEVDDLSPSDLTLYNEVEANWEKRDSQESLVKALSTYKKLLKTNPTNRTLLEKIAYGSYIKSKYQEKANELINQSLLTTFNRSKICLNLNEEYKITKNSDDLISTDTNCLLLHISSLNELLIHYQNNLIIPTNIFSLQLSMLENRDEKSYKIVKEINKLSIEIDTIENQRDSNIISIQNLINSNFKSEEIPEFLIVTEETITVNMELINEHMNEYTGNLVDPLKNTTLNQLILSDERINESERNNLTTMIDVANYIYDKIIVIGNFDENISIDELIEKLDNGEISEEDMEAINTEVDEVYPSYNKIENPDELMTKYDEIGTEKMNIQTEERLNDLIKQPVLNNGNSYYFNEDEAYIQEQLEKIKTQEDRDIFYDLHTSIKTNIELIRLKTLELAEAQAELELIKENSDFYYYKTKLKYLIDALDETIHHNAKNRFLGNYYGKIMPSTEENLLKAVEHFELAITNGPENLENYLDYARNYAKDHNPTLYNTLKTIIKETDISSLDQSILIENSLVQSLNL